MIRTWCVAVLMFAVVPAIAPLAAQGVDSRPVHVGVMGGASIPLGLMRDATQLGWNAGAFVSIRMSGSPLSLRIDGQWHQLEGNGSARGCPLGVVAGAGFCPEPIDVRVIDGSADIAYTFGRAHPGFYLLAGGGVYGERATTPSSGARGSATKFGLNAGAGITFKLGSLDGFFEARYHNIIHGSNVGDFARRSDKVKSLELVPISLGLTF